MTVPGPYQLAVHRHGQSEWNGPDLRPDPRGGRYPDPHAARDAIDAIRRIT